MVAWAIAAGVAGILVTILWIKLSVKRTRLQKQFFSGNGHHIDSSEHVLRIAHDVNGLLIVTRAVVLKFQEANKSIRGEKCNDTSYKETSHAAHVH